MLLKRKSFRRTVVMRMISCTSLRNEIQLIKDTEILTIPPEESRKMEVIFIYVNFVNSKQD